MSEFDILSRKKEAKVATKMKKKAILKSKRKREVGKVATIFSDARSHEDRA